MKITTVMNRLINESKYTKAFIARELGYKNGNAVTHIVENENASFSNVLKIVQVLGYDIVIQNKNSFQKGQLRLSVNDSELEEYLLKKESGDGIKKLITDLQRIADTMMSLVE